MAKIDKVQSSNIVVKEEKPKVPVVQKSDAESLKETVANPVADIKATEPVTVEKPLVSEAVVAPPLQEEESSEERKARLNKRINKIINRTVAPSAPYQAPVREKVSDEEINKLIKDGKTEEAIKLAEDRATERATRSAKESVMNDLSQEEQVKEYNSIREAANRKVWEKYPDVLDVDEGTKRSDEVPMAKALQEIYAEKPYLAYLPDAPEIALEMAERRLGIVDGVKKAKEEARKEEAQRQSTVHAASAISSSNGSASPQASKEAPNLSADQKLVARKLGLTEEEYSGNLGKNTVVGADYYAKYRNVKRKA